MTYKKGDLIVLTTGELQAVVVEDKGETVIVSWIPDGDEEINSNNTSTQELPISYFKRVI